ncbi:MAG: glycerol-3-phosphate 1-O-acyltransferase PlsY [Deltaproteobacteria bacterium]|nr:glycerol-3-phosphate 1-O-acyltransferase PlsY [Deltaproteobacteria bacterium]
MNLGQWVLALLLPLIAYLLGSIPFGLLIAHGIGRVDIRDSGSGNIGATNVRRTVGTLPALMTLVGDIGKGFLPMWWAQTLVLPYVFPWARGYLAVVGLCALAGHLYPVFLKFRTGGKGVATAAGCLLAVSPGALGVSGLVFVMMACALNRVSAASLAATAVMPLAVWVATGSPALTLWAGVTAAWIWSRHRANIRRLAAGTEPPIWKSDSNG